MTMDPDPLRLPLPLMNEWLQEKAKDCTPGTIRTYERKLRPFSEYLRRNGVTRPQDITRSLAQGFVDEVFSQPWCRSTKRSVVTPARNWMGWLKRNEVIAYDPFGDPEFPKLGRVHYPHKQKTKLDVLQPRELALVFETHRLRSNRLTPFHWHREEMILACMYGWGLGFAEMEELTVDQVDPELNYVTIKSTRARRIPLRHLPMTKNMRAVVIRWVTVRHEYQRPTENALLIDTTGAPFLREGIREWINRLGKEAGVRLTSRRMRDTAENSFRKAGIPTEEVAQILGIRHHTVLNRIEGADTDVYSDFTTGTMDKILSNMVTNPLPTRGSNDAIEEEQHERDQEASDEASVRGRPAQSRPVDVTAAHPLPGHGPRLA